MLEMRIKSMNNGKYIGYIMLVLKGVYPKPLLANISDDIRILSEILAENFKQLQTQYDMCGSDQ